MSFAGVQSASLTLTAPPHLHAGMKSVWTHVNVQGTLTVRPETTGVFALVNLDTQEILMVLPVRQVSRDNFDFPMKEYLFSQAIFFSSKDT